MPDNEPQFTPAELQLFLTHEERIHNAANRLIGEYRRAWLDELGLPHWEPRNAPYDERKVTLRKLEVDGRSLPYEGLTLDDIGPEFISYGGDERWSNGGHEHHTYLLPTSYLFEDWRPALKAAIQQARAEREAERAAALADLKELAELHKKYPQHVQLQEKEAEANGQD